ncbi:MAG TPA: FtsX-like permease family protein [Stellaceae bacterium]|nr:FtsX-like permease family protein [Stellaceae bacterium]
MTTLAWRIARRELRGGIKGFRVFLGCLALGVAVIASVGSLSAAVKAGLARDARGLLGGDVELQLFHRTADAREHDYLAARGQISEVAQLRAMARTLDGERTSLIELKSVDAAYPLYGAVTLAVTGGQQAPSLAEALALKEGHWGAVVAPALMDRLGIKEGDSIRVGDAVLTIRARLVHEPDAIGGLLEFGPRVMVAEQALAATGLVTPGTLIGYSYRVKLPPGGNSAQFIAGLRAAFPDAGWRIRDLGNAAPNLQRLLDRLTVFMTLVGLTALLVGGVGIGNAVASYLAGKTETIATLKCLGASRRLIFATYLAETLALAAGGIALGLVLGALAPFLAASLLPAQLPVSARLGIYPAPLLLAAIFGVLATLAFTLWPLGAAAAVNPAGLFRARVEPVLGRPPARFIAAVAVAGLLLAGLAVMSATDRRLALWSVLGAVAALALFRLAAAALVWAARHAGRPRQPGLRLALANLCRPGAPTAGVLASLGLGLAVLVAIALVEGNLMSEIETRLPEHAPSFFFIDIQPGQAAPFDALLRSMPGVTELARVPSLRGRISALNGVPVERAAVAPEARWAINSDRGLTYAATLPAGSRLVAGSWWPADYRGPPLVSFDAELARGMGLKIGDTLTVNVLGRELTARIANLREIDWTSLGLNFAIVLSPGTLDGAPQTHIATARTAPGSEAALARAVSQRFPNVSAISVRDALANLAGVIDAIAAALTAIAALALAAGILVLAGAVAAGHRRRVYDAVVLKVLGATRRDITRAYLIEYGLLGLAAAVLAAGIGTLAAWLVLTRVMGTEWSFRPGAVAATVALATLLTLFLGYAGTWRALGAKPAPYLRNE